VPFVAILLVLMYMAFPANWNVAIGVTCYTAIILLSLVVLTGYAGQISLAQFALGGMAAYIAGRLVAGSGWPMWLAMLVGAVGVIPVGLIFALPALRTRGVNLAIITLGLGVAIQQVVFDSPDLTGGQRGTTVGPLHLFGISFDPVRFPERYATLALGAFALLALMISNIRRGPAGHRLLAIRANERAAASLGVSAFGVKFYAFGLSAAIAGAGGILLAFSAYSVVYPNFDPLLSIDVVAYTVIGGLGYISGAIGGSPLATGTVGLLVTNALFGINHGTWVTAVSGGFLIFLLIVHPDGSAGLWAAGVTRLARRLMRRNHAAAELHERTAADGGREPVSHAPLARRDVRGLQVRDLTVRFGGVVAVDAIDLDVPPGQVVGLVGPNGAGKTTLIDAITGFVSPVAGSIVLGDQHLERLAAYKRARLGLARAFQGMELFDDASVEDNIRVACDDHRRSAYFTGLFRPPRRQLTPRAHTAIDQCDVRRHLHQMPNELSHGRRRMVALARTLASDPSVVLLDEPAAGLDLARSEELGAIVREMARDWGLAVLLVEHDIDLVTAVCDSVVVLDAGCKIAEGAPNDVFNDPHVIAAFVGASVADRESGVQALAR
jgi:sulfate-transporting ATPase